MSNFKNSIIDTVIKSINNEEYVRANIGINKNSQRVARFTLDYGVSVSVTDDDTVFVNFRFPSGEHDGIDFNEAYLIAGKDRVRRAEQRLQDEKNKYQELVETTSKN